VKGARVLRFGVVGLLNTGVYYLLYLLFLRVAPYLAAHLAAVLLSMVGSYFLNCFFTFRTPPTLGKFLLFPLSNATNFAVTSIALYLLVGVLHLNKIVSPLLAAVASVPITFVVARAVLVGRTGTAIEMPEKPG
jgi:putative flippase GtrA